MQDWPVQTMAVSDLVAAMADYNPRVISKAAQSRLRESLEKFGLASSLTYNKRTGRLVSGHQRVQLLSEANVDRVTVTIVDVDEQTERALNVTMNREDLTGDWDREALDSLLEEISTEAPDLSAFLAEMPEFKSSNLEALVSRIASEPEWQPGSNLPDPGIVADALAAKIRVVPPSLLGRAALVAVSTGSREILILANDPALSDFASEIRTAIEAGIESPFTQIFERFV